MESTGSLHGVYKESTWSLHGVYIDYMESTWSLRGSVGDCKVYGHLGEEELLWAPGSAGPTRSLISVHAWCISDQKKGKWTQTYPHKKLVLGGGSNGRRSHCSPGECRTPRISSECPCRVY